MTAAILALYRIRTVLFFGGVLVLVAIGLGARLIEGDAVRMVITVLAVIALASLVLAGLLFAFGARALPQRATLVVTAPVIGRWVGVNSPATKVPSHGIRAYGQAYAIDLVHEPIDGGRPVFGDGPAMRRPDEYPAFGQPVLAMTDGIVVAASDWRRDHRARSTMAAVVYMMVEGAIRELGGPGFIIGNHVTIRRADGVFATVAHLQRGSITVQVGDRVRAGDVIARCGNSGNTSEPHVHEQLMDRRSPLTAQGIPMAFAGILLGEGTDPTDGLPADGEHLDTRPASS